MTVTYTLDVSSVSSFSFARLLLRWKGSIFKSVLMELIVWLIGYYIIFFIYRFALNSHQQRQFEQLATDYDESLDNIPLTFMLGFFVTIVIDRWRQVFNNMGWIENVALTVGVLIRGADQEARQARRSIIRYIVLSQVLVFRNISMRVRRRFPSIESIIRAGFLREDEKKALEEVNIQYNKYWAPIQWAMILCHKMGEREKMNPTILNNVLIEVKNFRTNLAALVNYDWVPIPIAYPQVVFLAVRTYFAICMLSRQFIIGPESPSKKVVDQYVPTMTILQFIFIVGWSKVAEQLLNPLGEDDDDFECNFLIDKNLATGLAIVDECYDYHPEIKQDLFQTPEYIAAHKVEGFDYIKGSAAAVDMSEESSINEDAPEEAVKRTFFNRLKKRLGLYKKKTRTEHIASFCGDDAAVARSRAETKNNHRSTIVWNTNGQI